MNDEQPLHEVPWAHDASAEWYQAMVERNPTYLPQFINLLVSRIDELNRREDAIGQIERERHAERLCDLSRQLKAAGEARDRNYRIAMKYRDEIRALDRKLAAAKRKIARQPAPCKPRPRKRAKCRVESVPVHLL